MIVRSVPIRAVTQGPKSHWFNYYDKLQFDPAGRYMLGMEVDFDDRFPTPRDPHHILAFACTQWEDYPDACFWLFDERNAGFELVMDNLNDSHCTYLPGGDWIVNDTYPRGEDLMQTVCLHRSSTGEEIQLAKFHAPPVRNIEWRCDLHPRHDPAGSRLSVDSCHAGNRQMYLLDLSGVV